MPDNTCFDTLNFFKIKEYILFRLSISGMGKFYIEYPLPANDSDQKPGNKKMPDNPENVFDIFIDNEKNIVFKNNFHLFQFNSGKGLTKEIHLKEEETLANEIFCHLLKLACVN